MSVAIFPPPNEWSGVSLTDLEAAVFLSVYTDRRVEPHELLADQFDRRGSWQDSFPRVEGDVGGSRIWLFERSKLTSDPPRDAVQGVATPERAETFLNECLVWMLTDGVVTALDIAAERLLGEGGRVNGIAAEVVLVRDRSTDPLVVRFDPLWEAFRNG